MKIEIRIDEECQETKIIVVTDQVTDEVNEIIKKLSNEPSQVIAGFQDEQIEVLDRVFSESGDVFAETTHGTYKFRLKLYEVEERLEHLSFVRISKSEIINLKKVKNF